MQDLLNCSLTKVKYLPYYLVSISDLFFHREGKDDFPQKSDQGRTDSKLIGSKWKRTQFSPMAGV